MTTEADELEGKQLLEDFLAATRKNHFSKLTQTAFGLPSGGRTRCKLTRIEKPAKTQKKRDFSGQKMPSVVLSVKSWNIRMVLL